MGGGSAPTSDLSNDTQIGANGAAFLAWRFAPSHFRLRAEAAGSVYGAKGALQNVSTKGTARVYILSGTMNGLYHFAEESTIHPYLIAGGGG